MFRVESTNMLPIFCYEILECWYDVKDSFYENLVRGLDKFPNYNNSILLRDFNGQVRRGDIFKPTNGKESSYEISNAAVNIPKSKNLGLEYYVPISQNL
jgi:hypothetical protein